MTRLKYYLILSLVLHILLMFIFIKQFKTETKETSTIQLLLEEMVPPPDTQKSDIQQVEPVREKAPPASTDASKQDTSDSKEQSLVTKQNQTFSNFSLLKKYQQDHFFKQSAGYTPTQAVRLDSLFQQFVSKITIDANESNDPMENELFLKNLGLVPASQLPPPEREEKTYKTKYDFVPSKIQIQALKLLSEDRASDQLNLYSRLKTTEPTTMETFIREMDLLYKKGFVTRKKISPENVFNGFGIPVEMDQKNRKNPVYQYTLQIDPETLVHYLESRLDLIKEEGASLPSDSITIEQLNQKLQILR